MRSFATVATSLAGQPSRRNSNTNTNRNTNTNSNSTGSQANLLGALAEDAEAVGELEVQRLGARSRLFVRMLVGSKSVHSDDYKITITISKSVFSKKKRMKKS